MSTTVAVDDTGRSWTGRSHADSSFSSYLLSRHDSIRGEPGSTAGSLLVPLSGDHRDAGWAEYSARIPRQTRSAPAGPFPGSRDAGAARILEGHGSDGGSDAAGDVHEKRVDARWGALHRVLRRRAREPGCTKGSLTKSPFLDVTEN